MEKNNFKKLFLRNVCLISLLLLGSTALDINFSSEEEYEKIKILITSNGGLQFSKEDSSEERKIIYDCLLGLENEGRIDIFDQLHSEKMKSLIIKNCYRITLKEFCGRSNFYKFQELKISNVTFLELHGCSWRPSLTFKDLKVSINNVRFLKVNDFFSEISYLKLSLNLENMLIDTLPKLFGAPDIGKFNLHLKNIKVADTATRAIHSEGNANSVLIVEDSHFEDVHTNAFVFRGTVKIINNTFSFLDEAAFSINTSTSFMFSGNHVKRMQNPFYIMGSEVNIVNNVFDSIVTPWLPQIIDPEMKSFKILNITGNIIRHWSQNLFYMEPKNFPDIIIFEDNYLNCSCQNVIIQTYKLQDYISEVFLNKQQKNFCSNLGNCPLQKVLSNGYGICSGTFRCPEDDHNEDDENARMWPSHIKSILSVLKNIDTKLDQIVLQYNSSIVDKPN